MAVADNRQRYMPLPDDRLPERGEALATPEAVLLVNPVEPEFKGEVFFLSFHSLSSVILNPRILWLKKKNLRILN